MSVFDDALRYSRPRLEDLAAAMGVNSAYLWVNPTTNALSVKEELAHDEPEDEVTPELIAGSQLHP